MEYQEYPRALYHSVKGTVVVCNDEECNAKLSAGWQKILIELTEEGKLQQEIDYHENEYIRLKGMLQTIKEEKEELAKIEVTNVDEEKPVVVETSVDTGSEEVKPSLVAPRRGRKV